VLAENTKDGFVKVVVTDINDLWHLQNIIKPGDCVTAKTLRNIFIDREEKKEKVRKKLVVLKIRVEKVEFAKSKNILRIAGRIEECPEEVQKGSYHTIEVHVGKILKIEKEWKPEEMERLRKSKIKISHANGHIIGEFLMHASRDDGLAVYGFQEVKNAVMMGAVKILLIPEEKLREFEDAMKEAEKKRSEVLLVSKDKEWGEKFCKQYDIAALLRFVIS